MLIPHSFPQRPSFTAHMHLSRLTLPRRPPAAHLPSAGGARHGQRSRPVLSPPLWGIAPARLMASSPPPLYGIEVHVDKPPFVQASSRCYVESACYTSMFQVFQMFQRYVANVVYQCCKSRSGCCTCCNGYTRMFQVYVLNVSYV
jgi:hypothetical protein